MSALLYDELNALLTSNVTPLTTLKLEGDYDRFAESLADLTARQRLKKFVRLAISQVTDLIDLNKLAVLVTDYERRVQNEAQLPKLQMFEQVQEDLDQKEVHTAVQQVYQAMRDLQQAREQGHELLGILRSLSSTYETLRKSLNAFVACEDTEPREFQHVSERKRFMEPYTNDLAAYEEVIAQLKARTVKQLEEVLPARNNLLMRTDSAIRLLCKVYEPDAMLNRGQSRTNTGLPLGHSGTNIGDPGGFDIQQV